MNIYAIADRLCFYISTFFVGCVLGVGFALVIIIAEIGLVRWP